MHRRAFLQSVPVLFSLSALDDGPGYVRYPATSVSSPPVDFPVDKRIPIGLTAFPVPTVLRFTNLPRTRVPAQLRLTAAIDFRELKLLELYLPVSGTLIGRLDVRYAYPFQPFETAIESRHFESIEREGIGVRQVVGEKIPWFLLGDALPEDAAGLAPQMIVGSKGNGAIFDETLRSMNSFSPFGWMGGCVQDALYEQWLGGDLRAEAALRTHLAHYLDDEVGIRFENPATQALDGRFNSIEDFLPFAAIVGLYPQHPSVQMAVDFCLDHRNADGLILNGGVTTEGCYTVGYPLAAIAVQRKDAQLAQVALNQVGLRGQQLVSDAAVYQRAPLNGAPTTYRNWGRGVAWYLLGTIKTLQLLEGFPDLKGRVEVERTWNNTARWVGKLGRDHLWCAYIDRPETGVDASASAGIAAALAWGGERRRGRMTYRALLPYLTADGLLGQVTQINRGGEDLQSGGYRVIAQFGMGLLAQLGVAARIRSA